MQLWRITNARHSATALSGAGASQYGGRWNSPGQGVIYVAPSVASAALEIVAHAGTLVEPYVAIELDVPNRLVAKLDITSAPNDWARRAGWCRAQGDQWLTSASSAGLSVPSAILGADVPEWNVVINVAHPDFAKIRTVRTLTVWLDERLGPNP